MRDRLQNTAKKALSFVLALSMLLTQTPMLFGGSAAQTSFSIAEEDSPTHHKTIVDNGDGTYDINLDVHGYQSREINIAIVVDVSSSMKKSISGQESLTRSDILFDSLDEFIDNLYDGLDTSVEEVNVSIVAYGGTARILQTWTGDKSSVETALAEAKRLTNTSDLTSGTNPQAGLTLANLLYEKDSITSTDASTGETVTFNLNRPTNMDSAENYVLFFSDGGPNRCYVNTSELAAVYTPQTTEPDGSVAYYRDNGVMLEIVEKWTGEDGNTYFTYEGQDYLFDDYYEEFNTTLEDGTTVRHMVVNNAESKGGYVEYVDYNGFDGYESEEEFNNDYRYPGTDNLTAASLSSAPVIIENGMVRTPAWEFGDGSNNYEAVNIVSPSSTDYRKIAAQAALVEVEDIYEYAQQREIEIDVMTFGVGGWFTQDEKESSFPTAQRFIDLVAAVGNGALSAYDAEEAYLLEDAGAGKMAADDSSVNIADYTKVYVSSNTADAYYITDRNYSEAWRAEASATADVSDWVYVDLGGLYAFDRVTISWATGKGDYAIKVASLDPADESTWAEGGDASTSSNWIEIEDVTVDGNNNNFTSHIARYILVSSNARTDGSDETGYNFGINSINVYRTSASTTFDSTKNLVAELEAHIDWNATTDGTTVNESTTLVTDGDLGTVYSMNSSTSGNVSDGISIDLGEPQNISKVVIHWAYAPTSFRIETSYGDFYSKNDWQTLATVDTYSAIEYADSANAQTNLEGTTTIEFDLIKARYIAVGSDGRNVINGTANWAIKEIEVYANGGESSFSLSPAYQKYGHGILPLDSVDTTGDVVTSTPYYYINDAYDAERVVTYDTVELNADVQFDLEEVLAVVESNAFGGASVDSFDTQFDTMSNSIIAGFNNVRIYDTFSKYVTLAYEITGLEQKGSRYVDGLRTYTNPHWLTVKSYTSTNNDDGKNTSDTFTDYKLDDVQIDSDLYTTYYYIKDDPNGGDMHTESIELVFDEDFILENQSMIRITVTVKPSQYAIDTYYTNINAEDYVASLAVYDDTTGYSSADENGNVTDGGIDPTSSVYDRRTTGGYPDQAFNVVFSSDDETGATLYNTANPYYADDEDIISAAVAGREYVEDEYGFHTNVLAATNVEYYITSISQINESHVDYTMTASYDMPVIQVDLLDIPVKKVWNDGNADHATDSIFATISWEQNIWETTYDASGIASVYNMGTETKSVTVELNDTNDWSGVFKNIPHGYTYTVTETYEDGTSVGSYNIYMSKTYNTSSSDVAVDGHTFTISDSTVTDAQLGNGLIITNTHTTGKTVTKVWEGDDAATRPMSVTIQLYADGEKYGDEVVLSDNNNWTYTWSDLDEYDSDGDKISYEVIEVEVSEYNSYTETHTALLDWASQWQYYMSDEAEPDAVPENWYTTTDTIDGWSTGYAAFGDWANGSKQTDWTTDYLWLKKSFNVSDITAYENSELYLRIWFDQESVIYLNGVEIYSATGKVNNYTDIYLDATALEALKEGENVLAVYTYNTVSATTGHMFDTALRAKNIASTPASTDYEVKTTTYGELLPMGSDGWLYYTSDSDDALPNWALPEYDSIGWPTATAPFGNIGEYSTEASSNYLWVRHSFNISSNEELAMLKASNLYFKGILNENAEIYVNGRHVYTHTGAITEETMIPLSKVANEMLVLGGANAIAIKLNNTDGATEGVYLDGSLMYAVDTVEADGTITNVYQSEEREFSVVSTWDDMDNVDGIRPEYVTVQLYENGTAVDIPVILSPDNSWSYTWTGLTVGATYTVVQSTADGYTTTYDYTVENLAVILNVHRPETVDKTVTKIWDDSSNQDSLRPEKIKVQLYANGIPYDNAVTVTGTGDTWSYKWTDLPKYESGNEITWSVQEVEVPYGYTATYSYDRWTITNSHTAGVTSRTVTKVWEDNNSEARPTEVTVQLYANGSPVEATTNAIFPIGDSSWSYVIGTEEDIVTGDWSSIDYDDSAWSTGTAPFGDAAIGDCAANTYWGDSDIDISTIDDNNYIWLRHSFEIADEEELAELIASNLFFRTFYDEDPLFYINGTQVFTAETGYLTEYADCYFSEYDTNLLQVGTNVIAVKCQNFAGNRLFDLGLYYTETDFEITLNAENNWTYTWDQLPIRENGIAIKYAVYENSVPEGYSVSYSTASNDTTKLYVTNTLTKDVTVTKTWIDDDNAAGIRPDSIKVQLYANGEFYGESVTVTDDGSGNWSYTWTDVPYYADGAEVVFSVEEVVPTGYTPYYTSTNDGNLIIQNYASEGLNDFTVKKTWDDIDNVNGLRPESITVQLYQGYEDNYSAYGRPVKLSAASGWTYTWTGLLDQIVVDGTTYDVSYYAIELNETDGYTVDYSHNATSTEIVNTLHTQNIVIEKKDGFDPEVFLPGATFVLELLSDDKTVVDNNFVAKVGVTNENGLLVFENLPVGFYRVTETKAPEGYNLVDPFVIEVALKEQNVAVNKTAVATSTADDSHTAEDMLDGDTATSWQGTSKTDSFYVDLGVNRAINRIFIDWNNASNNWVLEYLSDGQDPEDANAVWTEIGTYTYENDVVETDSTWDTGTSNIELASTVVGRYIRMRSLGSYKDYIRVNEFEVYLDTNYEYAKDGFTYTSSVITEADQEGDLYQYSYIDQASNVGDSLDHRDDENYDDGMWYGIKEEDYTYLDIDPNTEGNQRPDEWIAVDLLENTDINKLVIHWENCSVDFRIIYLADGCEQGDWLDISKYSTYTSSSRTAYLDDDGNEVDLVTHTADNYSYTLDDVYINNTLWYIGQTVIYLDETINARYIGIISSERALEEGNAYLDSYYAIREIDMLNTNGEDPTFDYALSKSAFAYNVRQRQEHLGTAAIDTESTNYLETAWISDVDVEEQLRGDNTEGGEAVEGDNGITYWKSYRVADYKEWINVKLDGTVGLNHIVLEWVDGSDEFVWDNGNPLPWDENKTTVTLTYPEEYYILYSVDGSYWTEFYHVTDGDGGRDEYTFPEIQAKYVRVYIPDGSRAAGNGTAYALYSLELYATGDQYVEVHNDPQSVNSEVVIDYGLPVEIDVIADQIDSLQEGASIVGIDVYDSSITYNTEVYATAITKTSVTGKYGNLVLKNGKLVYTPTTMCFEDPDVFTYCIKTSTSEYLYSTLTVMPATNVYYEEDFVTVSYENGATIVNGSASTADVDLASGKPGYSNSTSNSLLITDGNLTTTVGSSNANGATEFFAVDLGQNTTVDKIIIEWENCAEEFYIAYLGDGGNPTDASAYKILNKKYTMNNDIVVSDAENAQYWGMGTSTITLDNPINARYIGVYAAKRHNTEFLKVREIELYDTTSGINGIWQYVADGTSGHETVQDTDRPGTGNKDDANNAYGFDTAYDVSSQFGLGKARKVTVNADNNPYLNDGASWPTVTFTFTGTGFDLVSMTSNMTGTIWVDVYKGTDATGSMYKSWLVDTYYGYSYNETTGEWEVNPDADSALYQIPVINGKDFAYGTYTVVVTAAYSKGFDHTDGDGYQYDIYFDGVRVYNPAGSTDLQLGEAIVNAYIADNEYSPNYSEVRTDLVDLGDLTANGQATGITFVDGRSELNTTDTSELAATMDAFKTCGPNNEIYLSYGQGVAFYIYSAYEPTGVQIGLKSITQSPVEATIKFGWFHVSNTTISSSTTRYYTASDYMGFDGLYHAVDFKYDEATGMYKSTSAIIISNTLDNDGILSVTNIKLTYPDTAGVALAEVEALGTYSLAGHTESYANVSAYLVSTLDLAAESYDVVREQYIENKVEFTPEHISAQWSKNCVSPGETVTLTVTTSTDVNTLTVNGAEAAAVYYGADGNVKQSADGAKKAVWTVDVTAEAAGDCEAVIEAIASDRKIYQTTATIVAVEY